MPVIYTRSPCSKRPPRISSEITFPALFNVLFLSISLSKSTFETKKTIIFGVYPINSVVFDGDKSEEIRIMIFAGILEGGRQGPVDFRKSKRGYPFLYELHSYRKNVIGTPRKPESAQPVFCSGVIGCFGQWRGVPRTRRSRPMRSNRKPRRNRLIRQLPKSLLMSHNRRRPAITACWVFG